MARRVLVRVWYERTNDRTSARRIGLNFEFSTDHSSAIPHCVETHSSPFVYRRRKANSIVAHAKRRRTVSCIESDNDRSRMRMFHHVTYRLLGDTEEMDCGSTG